MKQIRNVPKPRNIQFTQSGYDQLKVDFDALTEERKEIIIRLRTAREMGDLSENAAYHAAKFELGGVDRRLRRLAFLRKVGVVGQTQNTGIISFGNTVTVNDGGSSMQFMLVEGFESNPEEKKLSIHSPIGRALVGRKVGDIVTVHAPVGDKKYTIMQVA